MSANEPELLDQLTRTSSTERALRRIVTLFAGNDRMSSHELRVYEIALEGLGYTSVERRAHIEAAIQLKRDRTMARQALEGKP